MSRIGFNDNLRMTVTSGKKMFLYPQYDYIGTCLENFGYFAPTEITFLKSLLKKDDNVIEIGANNGCHAIYLSENNPDGKYFCFEPQLEIFKILCANCVLNNCKNVIPYPYAIGAKNELVHYKSYAMNHVNTGSFKIPENTDEDKDFLNIKTLDSFKEILELKHLKLIKIDVEGMELDVIISIEFLIKKFKPILFIEYTKTTFTDLCKLLSSLEYDLYYFNTNISQYFNVTNPVTYGLADINVVAYPKNFFGVYEFLTKIVDFDTIDFTQTVSYK